MALTSALSVLESLVGLASRCPRFKDRCDISVNTSTLQRYGSIFFDQVYSWLVCWARFC